MATGTELFLHEAILLLALHDEKGTIEVGSMYALSVGGALLAELIVRRRIELAGRPKRPLIQLVDAKPVGEPLLDEALAKIATAKRRASPRSWIMRLGGLRHLRNRLADGLCRRGILRAEEKEVLIFFKRRTYPALDPGPEREIVSRLRRAIFTDSEVDARTIVLLSLANAAGLLPIVFDKRELKARKDRIESLSETDSLGRVVKEVIQAVRMMVVMAAIGA